MANKYSQIFNSPYVPQYQAPNMGVYQQAGQVLNQRQQQGMESYDALQQSMEQFDVLPSDQPLLEKKVSEINESLSEFGDSNDFIDAMPAIRRKARDLQKWASSEEGAVALENKENATKTFEMIEDSDWSAAEKEKIKDLYLSQYEGAESGQHLGVMSVPNKVDVSDKADEVVRNIDKTTRDTLGITEHPETGEKMSVKRKITARDQQRISESIQNLFQQEDVLQSLQQEAQINGYDSEQEINDYINKKMRSTYGEMVNRYGPVSETMSNIQWGEGENISPSTSIQNTMESGILRSDKVIPDFDDAMDEIRHVKSEGNQEKYDALVDSLDMALAPAIEQGELSMEDYNFLKANFDEALEMSSAWNQMGLNATSYMPGAMGSASRSVLNSPHHKRLESIMEKASSYIEEGKGTIGTSFIFDNRKADADIKGILEDLTPASFDFAFSDDDDLSEKEKQQKMKKLLVEGDLEAVNVTGYNMSPLLRFRMPEEDSSGESQYKQYFVKPKKMQNIAGAGHDDAFIKLMETGFLDEDTKDQIVGTYMLHNIPASGQNIYKALPETYKRDLGANNYIAMDESDQGVSLELGAEGSEEQFTQYEAAKTASQNFVQSVRSGDEESAIQNYEIIARIVNNANALTDMEKTSILEGISGKSEMNPDDLNKLQKLQDPFYFSNKVEAFNFARTKQS